MMKDEKRSNATGRTATRNIYIDGGYAGTISFSPLTNWDTWATAELSVRINRGVHQVVLYFSSSNTAAINLDYLDMK